MFLESQNIPVTSVSILVSVYTYNTRCIKTAICSLWCNICPSIQLIHNWYDYRPKWGRYDKEKNSEGFPPLLRQLESTPKGRTASIILLENVHLILFSLGHLILYRCWNCSLLSYTFSLQSFCWLHLSSLKIWFFFSFSQIKICEFFPFM